MNIQSWNRWRPHNKGRKKKIAIYSFDQILEPVTIYLMHMKYWEFVKARIYKHVTYIWANFSLLVQVQYVDLD